MNLKNNDNCTVDFDRLDDPEESKKLVHLFNLQVYRKNIMSTEDFEQYKLYQKKKFWVDDKIWCCYAKQAVNGCFSDKYWKR